MTAFQVHGPMLPDNPDIRHQAVKILLMVSEGQITEKEANQLFSELWKLI